MYLFDTVNSFGLVNYYPIIDSVKRDIVGGLDPFDCSNVEFAADRFGASVSSLIFANGFCSLPSSNYLSYANGFSFTFWNLLDNPTDAAYFLSFYNDQAHYFSILTDGESEPEVHAAGGSGSSIDLDGTSALFASNTWGHNVVVYENNVISYYLNGELAGQITFNLNSQLEFSKNYFGKLMGQFSKTFFKGKMDEIRFYNRPLDTTQIDNDKNVASFLKKINY